MVLQSIILISLMAALSRMSGGGLGANYLDRIKATWLPEAVFALVIAFAVGCYHVWPWMLPAFAVSYISFQSGHGTVYKMRGWESSNPNRIQTIEKPIRPIFNYFGWSIYKPAYSWAVIGLKGFLIGLPLFPFGLFLALLWPFSYWVKNTVTGEYLSGAFTGLCIVIFLYLS